MITYVTPSSYFTVEFLKIFKWFKENKMKVNAGKLKVRLIHKRKQDHTNKVNYALNCLISMTCLRNF